MSSKFARRLTAKIVFIAGLALMILGFTFLLGFLEGTSMLSLFLSFLFVVTGALCAVLAIRLNKRSSYLFFASFFILAGIFLFLTALKIIPLTFAEAWPLLSVFSGLALLPIAWRPYGAFRKRYIVSSLSFVVLGCALLVFSLKMVPFSFSQFIRDWWPLLFLLGGLTLVLISLSSKNGSGRSE